MASIKITQLTDIGANLAANTLVPVVDMSGTPTTDKANLQIIGNLILSGAGGANFAAAAKVDIANTSSNTQVLFNSSGNIVGNANLTFNTANSILAVPSINLDNVYSNNTVFIGTNGNTTGGWVFGTDGILTWPSDYGDWKIGNSNGAFEITSTTSVTIHTDLGNLGAHFLFDQDGVFHAAGNIQMHGQRLSVGAGAESIPLVSPTVVAAASSNTYVQSCVFNFDSAGSADLVTNGADSTETDGWTDMGFTGHAFNDANYTITGPGDGYIFVESYANGMYGGNLVLATGAFSGNGDIIFATGGFTTGQDKARITGAGNLLVGYSTSQDSSLVQVNGNISANNTILSGIVKTGVFNTGTIPAAATAGAGARAFVTDATTTTFAAAYVGGAANAVPVYSDGTAWYIG